MNRIRGLADAAEHCLEQYPETTEAVGEDLYRIVTRERGGQVVFRDFCPSRYFYSTRPLDTGEIGRH